MKKLIAILICLLLASPVSAWFFDGMFEEPVEQNIGAWGTDASVQQGTTPTANDVLTTDGTSSTWSDEITLTSLTTSYASTTQLTVSDLSWFNSTSTFAEPIIGETNLTLRSNPSQDGLIIFGNTLTGMVFDEDAQSATIGGGTTMHTVNGSVENALWEFHQDGSTGGGGTVYHRHSNMAGLSSDATFIKSEGDHNSPLIVTDDSQLGHLRFGGYDGTDYALAADIATYVDGTPGDDDMPGRLVFSTTADGATDVTERMVIKNDGNVGIGTTSPYAKLSVEQSATDNIVFTVSDQGTSTPALYIDGAGTTYINDLHIDFLDVHATTTQTITNGSFQPVIFDVVDIVHGGMAFTPYTASTTIVDSGDYDISFSAMVDKTGGGVEIAQVMLFINNTEHPECYTERSVNSNTETGHFGFRCIEALIVGDVVVVKAKSDGADLQFAILGTGVTGDPAIASWIIEKLD